MTDHSGAAEKWIEDLNSRGFNGTLLIREFLASHTTFGIGGPADLLASPATDNDAVLLVRYTLEQGIPLTVLGGGANLLVSDRGIRGIVIKTALLNQVSLAGPLVSAGCGADISELAFLTGRMGLAGLHGFYGMPGSVGGALYMNARCYGNEISQIFRSARAVRLDTGELAEFSFYKKQWAYKHSPFQQESLLLLGADFHLETEESDHLVSEMADIMGDRKSKGHFRAPCAGSAFKNNRAFGKPSGQIIDEAGLRGLCIGDAAVSDWHANIVINKGGASATDIRKLLNRVRRNVYNKTGFDLEPEIQFAGEWEDEDAYTY